MSNERVYDVLEATTSQTELAHAPGLWWDWWQDYNESYQGEKVTYTNQVGQFDPCYVPWLHVTTMSCFPAGTPVRTLDGMTHVEEIRVGDRVLSQDVETGELAYKLVLQTTTRPPSELLTVGIGEAKVTTTKGHPFWVDGVGWKMAKHLQIGDPIHTLQGGKSIDNIQPSAPAKAYNLVVADFHTYFVGSAEVLVHDNTYRQPTCAMTPGLIASKLSSRVASTTSLESNAALTRIGQRVDRMPPAIPRLGKSVQQQDEATGRRSGFRNVVGNILSHIEIQGDDGTGRLVRRATQ